MSHVSVAVDKDSDRSAMSSEMEELRNKYPDIYEVWSARPVGLRVKSVLDLRRCVQLLWTQYTPCLKQAILNNIKWMEKQGIELNMKELASGVMKNKAGGVYGYDFLMSSPPVMPSMYSDGYFPMRYAHVLPALMVSNFMKDTQCNRVDMTVMCQGYGFSAGEEWWREVGAADTAVECVATSRVFTSYVAKKTHKPIKRLCIWLLCHEHTFLVAWEQSDGHDAIYFADNLTENPFRTDFLNKFKDRIAIHRKKGVASSDLFSESIFSADTDLEIQPDLMCVSFMARSTVFLNTMDSFLDKESLRFAVDLADPRFQAFCYFEFEKALSAFIEYGLITRMMDHYESGQFSSLCVWLPSIMNEKFVNINDIYLLAFDPVTRDVTNATQYGFFFRETSCFKPVSDGKLYEGVFPAKSEPGGCHISAAATGLRECRGVLGEALALILRK